MEIKVMIDKFEGRYAFLSNFFEAPVKFHGLRFRNNEAAFQSMKTSDREQFVNLRANEAKRLGRKVKLREDWESVKDNIMYEIVVEKFKQNQDLKFKLLDTGDAELVEGNWWNDTYWGVCEGVGENKLGKILMKVREELRNEI